MFIIISHVPATTTTPSVAVVSLVSTTTVTVTMAPTFIGPAVVLGHDVVLPPPLIPMVTMRGAVGPATLLQQQQPQGQMHSLMYANYTIGSPQVSFSLSELSLPPISLFWCLLWCFLSTFRSPCCCHVHQWGLNHWGSHHHNPLVYTCGRQICILVLVHGLCPKCVKCLLPTLLEVGGSFMLLTQMSFSLFINMAGHTALGPNGVTYSPTFPTWQGRYFLLGFVPPSDTVNSKSLVGNESGNSGVVIEYQSDEFTHTWWAKCSVARSDFYPGPMGKVSTLNLNWAMRVTDS